MLKKLLLTFISISLISLSALPARAQTGDEVANSTNEILTEFCERRQGSIINLETWYAGRCYPDGSQSSFMGDSLGFGDIIILHLVDIIKGSSSPESDADFLEDVLQDLPGAIQGVSGDSGQRFNYISFLKKYGQAALKDNESLAAGIVKLTALPYKHQPASTSEYIAHVRSNLQQHNLVQPAYAQAGNATGEGGGYGFSRLEGFLPLWRAFRNMAYFFFILAFVIYGFMIMFRVKINPQTAANIQLALPKLITTLILITFSYAIVGLLIDFMWVGYYLVLNALHTFGVFGHSPTDWKSFEGAFLMITSGQIGLIPSLIVQSVVAFFSGLPGAISAILGIDAIITGIGLLAIGFASGGALPIIVAIILIIAILIAYIKLFVKLITAYVTIFINLVLSPLILLGGVLPGKGDAFGGWITNLVANIIVFPVASILLMFSGYFMAQTWGSYVSSTGTTNPPAIPLLSPAVWDSTFFQDIGLAGANTGSWFALIGLALLLMAPKFVDMVMDAFKVKPFPYGSAAMESLMAGYGIQSGFAAPKMNEFFANKGMANVANKFSKWQERTQRTATVLSGGKAKPLETNEDGTPVSRP